MAEIMTFSQAGSRTIEEEMRRDPTIFTYGWGMPSKNLVEEFGWERACYSGICETQEAGAGVGAALAGMRPIVKLSTTNFALDGWGQIVLQAPTIRFKLGYKVDCPVVLRMNFGRYMWSSGVHHCGCYHNWLANSPGLIVVVPSTPADVRGLWRTILREAKDPVAFMEQNNLSSIKGPVPDGDYTIPLGVADIKREGSDVTIVALAYMVHLALEAAKDLAKEGIDAEVWDPRTLTPLDRESLIDSARKTGALVVVDQAPKSFGTTGEFMATIAEAVDPVPPMVRVATMDVPIPFSAPLEEYVLPNKNKIVDAVYNVLERKNGSASLGMQKS